AQTGSPALPRRRGQPPGGWRPWPLRTRSASARRRPRCLRPAGFPCASWRALARLIGGGQVEAEHASRAVPGLRTDATAVAFDHASCDGQADAAAGALLRGVQALERLEQLASITHVETAAVVAHRNLAPTV